MTSYPSPLKLEPKVESIKETPNKENTTANGPEDFFLSQFMAWAMMNEFKFVLWVGMSNQGGLLPTKCFPVTEENVRRIYAGEQMEQYHGPADVEDCFGERYSSF